MINEVPQGWQKINVNDLVRVRLTDHGRAVYAKWLESLSLPEEYRVPKEESSGWSQWQLHELMGIFGSSTGVCKPLCFETNFLIRPE